MARANGKSHLPMANPFPPTPAQKELFTRERRRSRLQDFLSRYESEPSKGPSEPGLFSSAKPLSPSSAARGVAVLSR